VETGPRTFTRQEHEQVVEGPEKMLMIPPRHYCVIANPVIRNDSGAPDVDENGNIRLKHGDEEIRGEQEPFPLYPGEKLVGKITPLQVVAANAALRLRCIRDFTDKSGNERQAGDEWLFRGPGTYTPAVEVHVVEAIRATIIKENQALKLTARRRMTDKDNVERQAGEEWLVRTAGAYLPEVDESVVETVRAHVLTDKKALHLKAKKTFVDVFKKTRKAGQEWLVTFGDAETHIPDVYEEVVGEVRITTLNNRQYTVVLDPVDDNGVNRLGQKELRKGELSFF
jgi:major vault protein